MATRIPWARANSANTGGISSTWNTGVHINISVCSFTALYRRLTGISDLDESISTNNANGRTCIVTSNGTTVIYLSAVYTSIGSTVIISSSSAVRARSTLSVPGNISINTPRRASYRISILANTLATTRKVSTLIATVTGRVVKSSFRTLRYSLALSIDFNETIAAINASRILLRGTNSQDTSINLFTPTTLFVCCVPKLASRAGR